MSNSAKTFPRSICMTIPGLFCYFGISWKIPRAVESATRIRDHTNLSRLEAGFPLLFGFEPGSGLIRLGCALLGYRKSSRE
jgi:hypothetical protein